MKEPSNYDSNSDSDTDSSVKQEICRSKPLKKPARKKHALDKDFRYKKPCTRLVNGFVNIPTIFKITIMNSARSPMATTSTHPITNESLNNMI